MIETTREFNGSAGPRGYLTALMRRMKSMNPADLSIEDRCKYVQHLRNHILQTARATGDAKTDASGQIASINENAFTAEVAELNRWNAHLDYSQTLKTTLEENRKAFVRHMRSVMPMESLTARWRPADRAGRIALLSEVQREQYKIYKKGAIDLLPSKIVAFRGPEKLLGFVTDEQKHLSADRAPDLHINEIALNDESPARALWIAHHEQTHLFLLQLAMARHRNMMPQAHPLYADSCLHLAKKEFMSYVPAVLREGYFADPEEKLAHREHEAFRDEFTNAAPGLSWSRFMPRFS